MTLTGFFFFVNCKGEMKKHLVHWIILALTNDDINLSVISVFPLFLNCRIVVKRSLRSSGIFTLSHFISVGSGDQDENIGAASWISFRIAWPTYLTVSSILSDFKCYFEVSQIMNSSFPGDDIKLKSCWKTFWSRCLTLLFWHLTFSKPSFSCKRLYSSLISLIW